ncbi:MAG TPA: hypothetical protein VLV83_12925 [Acidobacteriota bacterium]|nr:hypothetical protein [Acidobacteriota bacterium]
MNKRIAFLTLLTALLCVGLLANLSFAVEDSVPRCECYINCQGQCGIIDVVGFCMDANGRNWTLYSGDCDELFCWDFPLVP